MISEIFNLYILNAKAEVCYQYFKMFPKPDFPKVSWECTQQNFPTNALLENEVNRDKMTFYVLS